MKNKRVKTVTAGRLVFSVCYTQALPTDEPRERAAKSKCSSLARQALNFRAAWQKLRLLLCSNFGRQDLWVTLGYDDEHLPPTRKAAKIQMQNFVDRYRAQRRKSGDDLRYVYNTEELQEDGTRRLHHHLVVNAGRAKNDYELIRSLWICGGNIEIRKLGAHVLYTDDFLELAQYMAKERNPESKVFAVGDKAWTSSRNLNKPEIESYLAEENMTITAPPGAHILDTDHKVNEYGSYDYIVYLMPVPRAPRKSPRAHRKPRAE